MAKKKTTAKPQPVQETAPAVADAEKAEMAQIIAEQSAELEKLSAEKKHKAPVITINKKKYTVLAATCVVKVDGIPQKVVVADLSKAANKAAAEALLNVEGQQILKEV